LYWIEYFSGTQFLIVFKQFYKTLLDASFNAGDDADYKICSLTDHRFFICPFISVQKDFGYSDATEKNDVKGRVESLFHYSSNGAQMLSDVVEFYKSAHPLIKTEISDYEIDRLRIPTYVINLPERKERRKHIEEQFKGREEFDVTIISACRHEIGAVGLWMSIRKIIEIAIANDDDVIIICEDDHEFTAHYSREVLLRNIIEAHCQQVDFLSGGSGKFGMALAISPNRVWTNYCFSAQFIVIFKKFFTAILNEPFDETIIGDMKLSDLTVNKMLLCPFISQQKDFGYSDVTEMHNSYPGMVTSLFEESSSRILKIHNAYLKHLVNGD
jgi:GR25 family glycosyltransferase involved in LPS biosynthesis